MIRGESVARLSNGKALTLKVNFATIARAAAQVSIPAQDLFGVINTPADPRQMLATMAIIEHGLRKHHPQIDEDALGDLMLSDGDAIGAALREAVAGAFGEAEADEPGNPPKPGTGTRSKRRGRKPA